jgi:2-(1,2-epoxy-1,2-dihydrophenyl)acetyl-CoA isomerase
VSEVLRVEIEAGVARLTLDRPKAANSIDLALGRALSDAAIRCDEDPDVRVIVIRADGRFFCAGGDLGSFASAGARVPGLLKELTMYLHAALSRFARGRAPVIAAVQGPAAGAGMSLACAADFVVASDAASFTMAYTRAGLTPDGSSTWVLPRLIGVRRTMELMIRNTSLSAQEAADWGLVNRVVPADQLEKEVDGLAAELAAGPTEAYGLTKRLLLLSSTEGYEAQMEHEARAIADAARSADGREGIAAFLEKRAPRFQGS